MEMQEIKEHFEKTIDEFDDYIKKLIPYYTFGINAAAQAVPFNTSDGFSLLDLGCGTGTLSKAVLDRFENAEVTCLDISPEMIKRAEKKTEKKAQYIVGDFNEYSFENKYDVITCSLALHHLRTDEDKQRVYNNIFKALKKGGAFIILDVFEGENEFLQDLYIEKWKEYMDKSIDKREIEEHWVPNHFTTDRPISAEKMTEMLRTAGFSKTAVLLKYYGYGIIIAYK